MLSQYRMYAYYMIIILINHSVTLQRVYAYYMIIILINHSVTLQSKINFWKIFDKTLLVAYLIW